MHGTIGTELMPLPVALVLPDVLRNQTPDADHWVEQFGFIGNDPDVNDGLPVGFAVSKYRPQSGSPSPTAFVGFSCALCHSTGLGTQDDQPGTIVYGPGSVSLDLFAWLDAFQAAIIEREPPPAGTTADPANPGPYRLTGARIAEVYQAKTGHAISLVDRAMVELWLRDIRKRINAGLPRFDAPYGHGLSRDPQYVPTGPTRTQPFRTLIRNVFNRPGNDMPVYTKIATVFSEDMRHRSQFDGSIADPYARSSLAAFAAGATVDNMTVPEIVSNIKAASDYTSTLRPPRFADLFPKAASADPALLAHGKDVYQQYCFSCHGDRDSVSGKWSMGPDTGKVAPLAEIKTDPERVMFRHYGELGERLFLLFPAKHPFHVPREDIFPKRGDEDNLAIRGYINAPLDGMALRAPFLHNASVLTLAELINLKPRRPVFYRGRNDYDPVDAGFASPGAADAKTYFKFDTTVRGNSNQGHDYPWKPEEAAAHSEDLKALLAYLKTL